MDSRREREGEEEEAEVGLEMLKQTAFKSKQNELAVWRAVETIVCDKLKEYPTSLSDDRKLLREVSDPNLRNIILLRKGEKEVLLFYQTMGRRMVRYLSNESRRGDLSHY